MAASRTRQPHYTNIRSFRQLWVKAEAKVEVKVKVEIEAK